MIFASAFVAPALCSSWDFVERLRAPRNLPKINLGLDRCPAIEAGAYATILSHCHVFVGPRLRASTARVLRAGDQLVAAGVEVEAQRSAWAAERRVRRGQRDLVHVLEDIMMCVCVL